MQWRIHNRLILMALLVAVIFMLYPMSAFSITPDFEWSKTFGYGCGHSVRQTVDGGYIITGQTYSYGAGNVDPHKIRDLYLIKTDTFGNELWNKTYGGSGGDWGYSVQQTIDGGYIIAGETTSYSAGNDKVYLVKTDAFGNELWNKTFGGSGDDWGNSVQQTIDGGYIVAGGTTSYGTGGYDVYLVKTDAFGNELWNRTFGGPNYDQSNSVQQTIDGGYIIAGQTYSYGAGDYDVYLVKTDAFGNELWNRTFGGPNYDGGYSVQQTIDGGYIIAGGTYSYGAGNLDVYLIKTDAFGNELWNKTFGGSGNDWGESIQQTTDGGYIVTGTIGVVSTFPVDNGADAWLIKTDASGKKLWDKTFGGSYGEGGCSAQQTSDGGYILAGQTLSYGTEGAHVLLVKVKPFYTLYYPDLTDTTNPNSWKSLLVIQNPWNRNVDAEFEIRSRDGTLLYSGTRTITAEGVLTIRPKDLARSELTGSAKVRSVLPLKGTCQMTRNNNQMTSEYTALT